MVFCKGFWWCNICFFDYGGIRVFVRVFSIVYVYWCFNTLNYNWYCSIKILTPCDVKWVVGQDVYTVTIETEIIVYKIRVKATFGDGNMAMINIWSDGNTYVVMVNGILHLLILMAITNEGLVFLL